MEVATNATKQGAEWVRPSPLLPTQPELNRGKTDNHLEQGQAIRLRPPGPNRRCHRRHTHRRRSAGSHRPRAERGRVWCAGRCGKCVPNLSRSLKTTIFWTIALILASPTDSAAAMAHSSIGNVAAGSTFATLQSAGAGGAGTAVVNGAAQLAGGIAATGAGARYLLSKVVKAKL